MGGRRAKYKQKPPAPLRDTDEARASTKKLGKRKANPDHEPESTTSRPTKKAKGDTVAKPPREKKTKDSEKTAETAVKPTPTKTLLEDGDSDGWENASDLEDADAFVDGLDEFDIDEE
jgi:25S rRNA (cytosine2870-C5)-methyltransferase